MKIYKNADMHNGYLFCYLQEKMWVHLDIREDINKEQAEKRKDLRIVVFEPKSAFECVDIFSCTKGNFDESVKFIKEVYRDDK